MVGRRAVSIEVQPRWKQLVLQLREQDVRADGDRQGDPPETHDEAPVAPPLGAPVHQIAERGGEEDRILLGDDGYPEGESRHHRRDYPTLRTGKQIESQQQPQTHQVVQQNLPLVVDREGREVVDERGDERTDRAPREPPDDTEQEPDTRHMYQDHQHAHGIDLVAEGLESAGQDVGPRGYHYPPGRRVVVEVRVRRQPALVDERPGLLDIDALVGEEQRIPGDVEAVRHHPARERDHEERHAGGPAARCAPATRHA